MTKRFTRRAGILAIFVTSAIGCGPSAPDVSAAGSDTGGEVAGQSLRVGLYPYVPRLDQFQSAIQEAWGAVHPEVDLIFVPASDWDGGYGSDPSGMDVFVFDAVFLDYFRSAGYLMALTPEQVENRDDFLPYAIQGVAADSAYSGIPMFGCANILFYREGDSALAAATTLSQVTSAVGQCTYTSQVPPDERGLMLDMAGGTTNACLYVDATESLDGHWPIQYPSSPSELNPTAIDHLQSLLAVSSYYNATGSTDQDYQRGAWFSQGYGRALVGFTETMSAMSSATRSSVQFRILPLGDDTSARPMFFSDVIGVSASTSNSQLAVELANLMASTDVMVAGMEGSESEPAQYLMPTRPSIFQALGASDPIYGRMQSMVTSANPILLNLGSDARNWINSMKDAIRSAVRADYPCGCDQDAGAIMDQSQAATQCPATCASYGGWNGQWRSYDGSSFCGCNQCGVGSTSTSGPSTGP